MTGERQSSRQRRQERRVAERRPRSGGHGHKAGRRASREGQPPSSLRRSHGRSGHAQAAGVSPRARRASAIDEVNDFLPDAIVNSDRIEEVIALLVQAQHQAGGRGDQPRDRGGEAGQGPQEADLQRQGILGRRPHPSVPARDRQGKPPHRGAGGGALQGHGGGGEHHQGGHQELRRPRARVPAPGPSRHLHARPARDEPHQEGGHRVPRGDAQARRLLQGALQGPPRRGSSATWSSSARPSPRAGTSSTSPSWRSARTSPTR